MLKQAEIFAFLALFFLVSVFLVESDRQGLQDLRDSLQAERHRNPPIVVLSEEQDEYRFPLGSASPTKEFHAAFQQRIVGILDSLARGCTCDVIEIVGHTDGLPVARRASDLDIRAVSFLRRGVADSLTAGSNVDLGLMRALAVTSMLEASRSKGRLSGIRYFVPLSAGQMILRDLTLVQRDEPTIDRSRRRIELRVLRSTRQSLTDLGRR